MKALIYIQSMVIALGAAGLLSCNSKDKFLQEPPPPPRPPPRYSKTYQLQTNGSMSSPVDVDILWVIDNSGTMGEEQQKVIDNSAIFIQQFTSTTQLHWRMGLISTSSGWSPYLGFDSVVDWTTPQAIGLFNEAVGKLGHNGSSTEMTFGPTMDVLNAYPNFLRKNAHFVLIVVSDEREQSYNISPAGFIEEMLKRVGGDPLRFITYGIVGQEWDYNDRYPEFFRLTNGTTYDLENVDYGPSMAELGKDLVRKTVSLNPEIMLDQRPIPSSIQVVYKGQNLKGGPESKGGRWAYNPHYNVIRFHSTKGLDPSLTDVSVSFVIDPKR